MDGMILVCRVMDLFLEAELVQKPDIYTANRYAVVDYALRWCQFIPRSKSVQRTPTVTGPQVFFPFILKNFHQNPA